MAAFQIFCSNCDGLEQCSADGLEVRQVGSVTGVDEPPRHTMVCPTFIEWQAAQVTADEAEREGEQP